jgi:hypothetical protein
MLDRFEAPAVPFYYHATLRYIVTELHRPLFARCLCGHKRRLKPMEIAAKIGWDITLHDIMRRLRCIACGSRDCQLIDFDPDEPPPPQPQRMDWSAPSEVVLRAQRARRRKH